ncbi:MurR/RpiR family transcriptional regulator [Micromonospora sp. WMMD1102]|uniref:MurR/RpiR family transcriptional regulator n=1 Tax=Micromonospora sp. WMMD1102 TaxID=3016105 RepID=UPI0024157B8B|nr:MurR/RpiR family transcriptional regulator [Micromonospora sp. WMMD1102]MDG4791736.1 MurR/RpiR family transcriptional regulator [Micromonospora sp. WMMD1102]
MDATPTHTAAGFGLGSRIRAQLAHMSQSMAKIGQLLLDNPELPLQLSITELAERAGTSAATVTRFCRLIGYGGYPPLRVGAAADLGRSSALDAWDQVIGYTFGPAQSPAEVLRTLLNVHVGALQATADLVDLALLHRVAATLASSRHVDIYGIGGSGLVAAGMHARLYQIGINAHAWTEVHVGLTSAALLGEGAVAIGVSNTGRTSETVEMLALAGARGAFTVAMTSNPSSPLAVAADVHIQSYAPGEYLQPGAFAAQHAQLFVFDLLYLMVAQQNYERTTSTLAQTTAAVANHCDTQPRPPRVTRGTTASPTDGTPL